MPQANDTNQGHILIVEDDRETCELLRHVLPEWNLTVSHTIAGAVSHYLELHFDLVMLDNWLPDGSGIDLCRDLRSRFPETPIVFMSAAAQKATIGEAISAGANRYFIKPFDPDELRNAVKDLLEPEDPH